MRCLLLKGGALGDFLVTLPLLRGLREARPDLHLTLVGNATAARLAVTAGLLQTAYSDQEARWAPFFTPAPLPENLCHWLASFDLILCFWPDPEGTLAAHREALGHPAWHLYPAHPTDRHACDHFAQPLRDLGYPPPPSGPLLAKSDARSLRFDWALHPGSGSRRKNWPLPAWQQLIDRLPGRRLVLLGPAEEGLRTAVQSWGHVLAAGSLEEVAENLQASRVFIGHDSGPSHLAAALGVPTVALFGPTSPQLWAPRGGPVSVLAGALSATEPSPHTVAEAAHRLARTAPA